LALAVLLSLFTSRVGGGSAFYVSHLPHMERVSFITTEAGDDLVLSFAVQRRDDPSGIESLSLIRTPKYEFILEEHERGVSVSFERHRDGEDEFLRQFDYSDINAIVRIQTTSRTYELDIRKVAADEVKQMRNLLKKLNYDQKFQTSGV
jgi:hypothetical protein